MRIPALLLSLTLPLAALAGPQGDDLGRFLADRGLVQRLEQAGRELSTRTGELAVHAMGFIGVPYKWGGNSPETGGLDCSGFVKAVYEQIAGRVLPRRSDQQAAATQPIDTTELQPGDLVFFDTMKRAFSHVGIYVGEGRFVHAPRTGAEIRMEDMRGRYWAQRFDGARRVPGADAAPPASPAALAPAALAPAAAPAPQPATALLP